MPHFQRIGVVAKADAAQVSETVQRLLGLLDAHGVEALLDSGSAAGLAPDRPALPGPELAASVDLGVVIGGDGTLLGAGRIFAPHGIPLLGVNLGRLGFMVDVRPDQLESALGAVLAGEYSLDERLVLEMLDTNGQVLCMAINDIVVRSKEQVRMLDFSTSSDGALISHHRADGFIVATPTGSTAYALSAGGPMLHPALEALALVPISPHTLSDRPLILHARSEIGVRTLSGDAIVTCDGQIHHPLGAGQTLRIRRASHRLRLLHPPGHDYFGILRDKLHWGSPSESGRRQR